MTMTAWKHLREFVLAEDRQYRGDTFVKFRDLERLFIGHPERRDGLTGRPPDPNGGVVVPPRPYEFDPSILSLGDRSTTSGGWYDDLDTALAFATSQSDKEIQTGTAQGGTVVKKSYGGKVSMQNAPIRAFHNDRLGSSMDRYDVVIVADFDHRMNRKGVMVPSVTIKRLAWAPSMGSAEERKARLQALLSGQRSQQLPRRPQPDRPIPPPSSAPVVTDPKVD
jgi:hypothetical protein